jgi:SAM-dependent methyltransferase
MISLDGASGDGCYCGENEMANHDKSNGYEEVAAEFLAHRGRAVGGIGAATVAAWSQTLPRPAAVLDLGCGTGVPISQVLIERGFLVHGVDAAPTMVAAFRERFPGTPVECASVEESNFFGRQFDGVVACGLFFLLDAEAQHRLIEKIAGALRSGGLLLFTAPRQSYGWRDNLTGRPSVGLGLDVYRDALLARGVSLVGSQVDEGENHYYFGQKT